ncbi:hypothetical protein M231_05625 [Tremella mesenterica]|uniref:Uncharacterized protein n=1 Tax=Tremella mesenterica TaxID=5217 RepID=A0A4Q1BHM2_TREME|nr:hypothetical protein M231_05625 [Tremella mesenterica]
MTDSIQAIVDWLDVMQKKHSLNHDTPWQVRHMTQGPIQTGTEDCGIYSLVALRHFSIWALRVHRSARSDLAREDGGHADDGDEEEKDKDEEGKMKRVSTEDLRESLPRLSLPLFEWTVREGPEMTRLHMIDELTCKRMFPGSPVRSMIV